MKTPLLNLFIALLLAATTAAAAQTGNQGSTAAPFGIYKVVALRNASDVATTADPGAGTEWLNQRVYFGEQQLSWLRDQSCVLWSVRETDSPLMPLEDPNLSDVMIGPLDSNTSSGDMRVNVPVELVCQDTGEEILAKFVIVDTRVLVASFSPWTVNLILEKPLTEKQITKFQAQLKDMKFYDGELTGILDEATVKGIGFYAEYRGSEYRFFRTAITRNLLDGLGVLDDTEGSGEAYFSDYQPKQGEDRLQDYSPDFALQIDNLPDVTFENLSSLLSRLNSLDLKASKMPGEWIDGKLALGANEKEYVPTHAEIMAAALGDRIIDFLIAANPDDLAKQWPDDRGRFFHYSRLEIRHADVMGSGRFFYASAPIEVNFEIPEVE